MLVAQTPNCLLLDEPTSALDIAHQIDILALVRRLVDKRGIGAAIRPPRRKHGSPLL